jgi:Raf kinase inhibitor-like YbhB/YbcL family protein
MKTLAKEISYKLLDVTSGAFNNAALIPSKYTCDGVNVNPPLQIAHIPESAKCLAIIVEDANTSPNKWAHWVIWNIPVTHHIKENETNGEQGTNDFCKQQYCGPCPTGIELHRYNFKVYALDAMLDLYITSERKELEKAMSNHILAFGELVGLYTRKNKL